MATFFATYPGSGGGSGGNASVGLNLTPIPGSATLVAGENPGGNLQPLQTDAAGNLLVTQGSGTFFNENIAEWGGVATSLGQKVSASSVPVVIASDQSTLPISAASLPLPTGASTSALQTTGNTSLASILANQTNGTQETTIVGTVPLPTGAATSALQTTGNTSLASILADMTNGSQVVVGAGTAGTSTGGVLSVQGVSGGTALPVTSTITGTPNINIANYGGTATTLGSKVSASSIPVVIASDQAALPLPTGASTSALQTSGNASLTTIAGAVLTQGSTTSGQTGGLVLGAVTTASPTYTTATTNPLSLTTAGALRVDASASTQPISGTVTANQGTANATPWNQNISQYGGTSTTLGSKVSASSIPVVIASDQGAVTVAQATAANLNATIAPLTNSSVVTAQAGTPTARTVTQAAITVGTTAVRATVSGSAPASTRVVLVITPDAGATGKFYIGSSTVTATGATRGVQIVSGQVFIANNDAGDYWIVSDTAAQTVELMEQA